jgi:hypothetical protein
MISYPVALQVAVTVPIDGLNCATASSNDGYGESLESDATIITRGAQRLNANTYLLDSRLGNQIDSNRYDKYYSAK